MKYLNASQAARMLGKSEKTIRAWIAQDKLHAVHLSKTRLGIALEDVKHLAASQGIEIATTAQQSAPAISSEILERLAVLERKVSQLEATIEQLQRQRLERDETRKKPAQSIPAVETPKKEERGQDPQIRAPGDDTISASIFAEKHGINARTMGDYTRGKAWNDALETVIIGSSGGRPIRGLTPAQQALAIAYFKRHGIAYTPCAQCPHGYDMASSSARNPSG